jgi:predicted dehydrogenase
MNILQFGDGRFGQNHKRILKDLGHEVTTVDIEEGGLYDMPIHNYEPDAVIITTSSVNHFPIAKACLVRNIPVFCEKPVLLKETQLQTLRGLYRENSDLIYMAGHQLVFMEEIELWNRQYGGYVVYMNSMRNGAIPREEGALFSLMVHDIALAFHVRNVPELNCIDVEGNKHELRATLAYEDYQVELYAVSVSKVRMRHTSFIKTTGEKLSICPDNWNRPNLLRDELIYFCKHVEKGIPCSVNGIPQVVKIMETAFKIQKLMEEKKNETATQMG